MKLMTRFSDFLVTPLVVWTARGLCTLAVVLVVWKSIVPSFSQNTIPHMDKVLHFGAYFVIAGLALLSRFWPHPKAAGRMTLITVIILGVVVELLQGMMAVGRSASIADAIANSLGACLAFSLWYVFSGRFNKAVSTG